MIKTIIRNLVSNSIKFSLPNTNVTISAIDSDNLKTIIVEDQGIGMDENLIANLFKTNAQTSRYGAYKEKRIGLGLLLCNEFANLHNGRIIINSGIGKGSQFIIKLSG